MDIKNVVKQMAVVVSIAAHWQFVFAQGVDPRLLQSQGLTTQAASAGGQAVQNGGTASGFPITNSGTPQLRSAPSLPPTEAGELANKNPMFMPPPPLKPNEFQKFIYESTGQKLPLFGLDFFNNTFPPVSNAPVSNDYALGAGDEVIIRGWGSIDIDVKAIIDRNGTISIPKVGAVQLAGVKAAQAQSTIRAAIGRYYRDFELSVSMGQLRSITIYVVGQARKPGAYNVSSLSTLVSGLFLSGGPNATGSLRHVLLKRGNQTVVDFDLYAFLSKGMKQGDEKLLDGDVIVIPAADGYVALSGAVTTPGIYELKNDKETVEELLSVAGGMPVSAQLTQVKLERVAPTSISGESRTIVMLTLDAAGMKTTLRRGDSLLIPSLIPGFSNAVTLRGNVSQPARMPWRDGLRVRDLIPNYETLISASSIQKQNKVLQPEPLKDRQSSQDKQNYQDKQMSLDKQMGLDKQTSLDKQIGIDKPFGSGNQSNFENQSGQTNQMTQYDLERLAIARMEHAREIEWGAVPNRKEDTEPLANRIGNLIEEVNLEYAVIERVNPKDLSVQLIPFNLNNVLKDAQSSDNQLLQPRDVITVFSVSDVRIPISKRRVFVRVEGEVAKPGVYQMAATDTLQTLVDKAGGLTPDAYLFGATFQREEVRRSQEENLKNLVQKLEAESAGSLNQIAQSSGAATDAAIVQARVQMAERLRKQSIDRLRTLKPLGRIAMNLSPQVANVVSQLPAIRLESADRLLIPNRPDFVYVFGSVNTESALLHVEGKTVSDYLLQAGLSAGADRDNIILIRADGSALTNSSSWGNSVLRTDVMPGDSIILPEKLDRESGWSIFARNAKDITQILYQFGLGAAAYKTLKN